MTDDGPSITASPGNGRAAATTGALPPAPPGHHTIRRAMTADETLRRRPPLGQPSSAENAFSAPRRRSSTFSDYSLSEARKNLHDDILNPAGDNHATSHLAHIPLAFALLPAVGGILFKNGSSVITDVMLLGLAAVFLHWSVTQPWNWYHSAQQIRMQEELHHELVFEEESEGEAPAQPPTTATNKSTKLDDVPEEKEEEEEEDEDMAAPKRSTKDRRGTNRTRQSALDDLYAHEIMALIACFVFPMLAAYLLHAIRNQLSRPSEGLVSNYNLTIFLLAAEIHPLSHLIKLVQARTLHLQKIVHANPYKEEPEALGKLQEVLQRLEALESRTAAAEDSSSAALASVTTSQGQNGKADSTARSKQEAAMVRDVRNVIQPELDALNRAVRRYEKKATVLAFQTESRLGALDNRLNDAISLAAAAAKNSASQKTLFGWIIEKLLWAVLLPLQALTVLVTLPFRTLSAAFSRNKKQVYERGGHRDRRSNGKSGSSQRVSSSDRVPTRLSKR